MITLSRWLTVASGVFICVSAGIAEAQTAGDTAARRQNCAAAAKTVASGNPGARNGWAWRQSAACSPHERVGIHLVGMRKARQSNDLTYVKEAIMPSGGLRDGRLFAEVIAIAGDRAASTMARVVAFMTLAVIRDPSSAPSYEGFTGGLDQRGVPLGRCSERRSDPMAVVQGPEQLPADFLRRINLLRDRVLLDPSESDDVRSAAACS